ncbi:aldehyde dehydrogenase [Virgibacillus sp. LDC-1]|uniref:aldehyde dehydrogenase n=1 Tax=Virgibacillus sp. LDC-1 TaxID=3039856 RepID=UPI0024DE22F1|nr:aldehyde dehydrogenase [Virgibacillus sp. LDC-1]
MRLIKIAELVQNQRQFFFTNQTKDYSFRINQLDNLKQMLKTYERDIYNALKADLNKSEHESLTTEMGLLYSEIDFAKKNLKKWMAPDKVERPITHQGTTNWIYKDPYGVTLIISPWNYPIQLAIAPAIGAIAAGNTVILKPSELTPATSTLLAQMVSHFFEASFFTVVEGDKETSQMLLKQRFDYIFFTGSTAIGKVVMEEASKHLTPVTLELGGKSPAIVDKDANLELAAKRIVWGKFTNAGQTCVAPDFLYVHRQVKKKLLKQIRKYVRELYGKSPLENKQYVRIVSKRHFKRLCSFLEDGQIVIGGKSDKTSLQIEPTVLEGITWEDSIMQEEIFGPLLPILPFDHIDEVVAELQQKEKPLALYYFGNKKRKQDSIVSQLSFGGGCMNDTLYHLANPHLPFGGVGSSGMGAYHGKYSFDTFTHQKSVMKQTTSFDLPFRYPGGKITSAIIKRFF